MAKHPKADDNHHHHHRATMLVWSCTDVKLLLTTLLFLSTIATLLPFLPSLFSAPHCTTTINPTPILHPQDQTTNTSTTITRSFTPVGSAAYLFVQMGAYRGGPHTFAIVGLSSKPLHLFAKPQFTCHYISNTNPASPITTTLSYKILPDWGYGRIYTVVVVNCTFPHPVNADNRGGHLLLHLTSGDAALNSTETIAALTEPPGTVNLTIYSSPPRYDYLYCGSSLYGDLSPQRVREWIAYHANLFGRKSHFVIHDAGGVHPAVAEVLRPWMERGVVTLQDIRAQERFDGYYHNQFLVVNDCLHRYRFAAKWIFFFDVDEFVSVKPGAELDDVMESLSRYTQFTMEQVPMSAELCSDSDAGRTARMWGMEKLVYRDVKRGVRRDRKYAVQPRSTFATGVHMSQNLKGKTLHGADRRVTYYHYHGTIAERRDTCRHFSNETEVKQDGTPYVLDDTMRRLAGAVKAFERNAIGPRLRRRRTRK